MVLTQCEEETANKMMVEKSEKNWQKGKIKNRFIAACEFVICDSFVKLLVT